MIGLANIDLLDLWKIAGKKIYPKHIIYLARLFLWLVD